MLTKLFIDFWTNHSLLSFLILQLFNEFLVFKSKQFSAIKSTMRGIFFVYVHQKFKQSLSVGVNKGISLSFMQNVKWLISFLHYTLFNIWWDTFVFFICKWNTIQFQFSFTIETFVQYILNKSTMAIKRNNEVYTKILIFLITCFHILITGKVLSILRMQF